MTTPTDTAKLADEIEALAKAIERAKANPPEPSYHIDGGERSRAFDSYVHDLMSAVVLKLPTIIAALRELEALKAENAKLREALERIERWFGEFPETGKFWTNEDGSKSDRPMSYGAAYGSNGERDYMRAIARAALGGGG